MTIRKFLVACGLIALVAPSAAWAAKFEITPFAGYRAGGDFDQLDNPSISRLDIENGESYGVTFDVSLGDYAQLEILVSRQDTQLEVRSPTGPSTELFDLNVDYYHVGGLYQFGEPGDTARPFVGFSMGLTNFDTPSGFSSEEQFSFSFAGGAKLYFGKHVGLRLQFRWTPTYITSTTEGLFCTGGGFCYEIVDNHYLNQIEASAGLILAF